MLAVALGLIVVGLNLISAHAFQIPPDRFIELVDKGVVERVDLGERILQAKLTQRIQFAQGGQRLRTSTVSVIIDGSLSGYDFEGRGIAVTHGGSKNQAATDDLWLLVTLALLGAGTWYLFAQARHNRRYGSPRQQLQELEIAYREGRLSRKDFEQRAANVSTDL